MNKDKTSFDVRIVEYEHIHSISEESFDCLFKNVSVNSNDKILDAGCGYGAITMQLLNRIPSFKGEVILLDNSKVQLIRAIEYLNKNTSSNARILFTVDELLKANLEEDYFDIVFAKMLIHEFPRELQSKCFQKFNKILKKGGKLIIWELSLDDDTQPFFQKIINYKDKLAGFDTLLRNRYFPKMSEIQDSYIHANFNDVKIICVLENPVITKKRLDSEFRGDLAILHKFNKYILDELKKIPKSTVDKLQIKGDTTNIQFIPSKSIFIGTK